MRIFVILSRLWKERKRFSHLGHYLVSVNYQFRLFQGKNQKAAAYMLLIVTVRCRFLIFNTEIRTLLWSKSNTCQHIKTEKITFSDTWSTLPANVPKHLDPTAFQKDSTPILKRCTRVRLTKICSCRLLRVVHILFSWFCNLVYTTNSEQKPRCNLCLEELRTSKQICLTATKGQQNNPQSGISKINSCTDYLSHI